MLGQLEKMRFDGFSKSDFLSGALGTFHVQINPESFTRNYAINYREETAMGREGTQVQYGYTQPQDMDVEFWLDGTGVLPANGIPQSSPVGSLGGVMDVREKINELKTVIYNYVGEAHEPPFVIITWAKESFRCRLRAINITFKLFKPDGTPLRALIKCSFREYVPNEENASATIASSPDLTHIRIAKDGDSLPLMCFRIYGDESRYLEIARVNQLTNFRNLKAGQQLFFPPIDKS